MNFAKRDAKMAEIRFVWIDFELIETIHPE